MQPPDYSAYPPPPHSVDKCSLCFLWTHILSFPGPHSVQSDYSHPTSHFIKEESEAQRGRVPCPRSHSKCVEAAALKLLVFAPFTREIPGRRCGELSHHSAPSHPGKTRAGCRASANLRGLLQPPSGSWEIKPLVPQVPVQQAASVPTLQSAQRNEEKIE